MASPGAHAGPLNPPHFHQAASRYSPCLVPLCRKWAVAGRDRGKLERLVASLATDSVGGDTPPPGIVVADVTDPASLLAMAK